MKRVLTIAGSDSGGGAGIQADLKTITVLGAYGMSVITALTAQNTVGVQGVHPVPVSFIQQQLDSVLTDIGVDGAKTGMLGTPEIVEAVAAMIQKYAVRPLVVDPVMVAKSGDALLSEEARETVKTRLLPLADVVTPNLPEAGVLCGFPVRALDEMGEAAKQIHGLGPRYVVIKGGHLEGQAIDLLFDGATLKTFEAPRLDRRNTHGTGCTFSAALATLIAQGRAVPEAVEEAKDYITRAIASGLEIGSGHGPTNHYAHISHLKERETVIRELKEAANRLREAPLGLLIPEVRSNLGYALPDAVKYEDVAAIPGRITQVGSRIIICEEPSFGVSKHIARIILAARSHNQHIRSAMNIRYSAEILSACRTLDLRVASFDREDEPKTVKEMEGSTLDWGTRKAIQEAGDVPDIIFDEGEVGKEPMIRILGETPEDVVSKVLAIGKGVGL
jgi:hydroxymethylpyrimidine/phosphomethylpyrimidine kinase